MKSRRYASAVHWFNVQNPEEKIQSTIFWDRQMRTAICAVQIDPRRDTENCFFVRGGTRRGAENTKGVSSFLCAAVRRAPENGKRPAGRGLAGL